MRKRFEELKKDQKGFTLVELIVVLVILAIMAALLAPALLGYIDKARSAKYLEEVRSITTAIQAINDERYAKADDRVDLSKTTDLAEINKLVYPTVVKVGAATDIIYKGAADAAEKKDRYIVVYVSNLSFTSQDTKTISATMANTTADWEVTVGD